MSFIVHPTPAQSAGGHAEDRAEAFLAGRGLAIVERNYRTRLGEIDLIARDGDTLVFVEVRRRENAHFGGAAGSIDWKKRRRLASAARHFLARLGAEPPCRFDVVALGDGPPLWLRGAFETA